MAQSIKTEVHQCPCLLYAISNLLLIKMGQIPMPERELKNPIYGEDELTDNTYTVPFEQRDKRSLTDHKFDNPVYGIGDGNTYEVPCDANALASQYLEPHTQT